MRSVFDIVFNDMFDHAATRKDVAAHQLAPGLRIVACEAVPRGQAWLTDGTQRVVVRFSEPAPKGTWS